MNLLTLGTVREALWGSGPGLNPYATRTADDIAAFDEAINQVIEVYMRRVKPAMLYRRFQLPIYDDMITLPRGLQSLLGIKLVNENNCACGSLALYTRFHEFAQMGAGCGLLGSGCGNGPVSPISETAQTFRDPQSTFTLRVKSTVTAGTIEFIGGYDTDWNEYFDSVSLSITNGEATTTREWPAGSFPRIHKDETTVGVELYSVDSDGEETLLAVYAPSETDPAYQRFSVPCQRPSTFQYARILSRLTYERVSADTDIVFPNQKKALKMGLLALNYEDKNDKARADEYWSDGLAAIDYDKDEFEGDAAIPLIDAVPGFGASNVLNVV